MLLPRPATSAVVDHKCVSAASIILEVGRVWPDLSSGTEEVRSDSSPGLIHKLIWSHRFAYNKTLLCRAAANMWLTNPPEQHIRPEWRSDRSLFFYKAEKVAKGINYDAETDRQPMPDSRLTHSETANRETSWISLSFCIAITWKET